MAVWASPLLALKVRSVRLWLSTMPSHMNRDSCMVAVFSTRTLSNRHTPAADHTDCDLNCDVHALPSANSWPCDIMASTNGPTFGKSVLAHSVVRIDSITGVQSGISLVNSMLACIARTAWPDSLRSKRKQEPKTLWAEPFHIRNFLHEHGNMHG